MWYYHQKLTWTKTVVFIWRVSTRSDKWFNHSRWSLIDWPRSPLLYIWRKSSENKTELNGKRVFSEHLSLQSGIYRLPTVPQTSCPSVQQQKGEHAPVCQSALSGGLQALASSWELHQAWCCPWWPSWLTESRVLGYWNTVTRGYNITFEKKRCISVTLIKI